MASSTPATRTIEVDEQVYDVLARTAARGTPTSTVP